MVNLLSTKLDVAGELMSVDREAYTDASWSLTLPAIEQLSEHRRSNQP